MNKNKGQNLTEFSLIVALVAIVCIIIFTLLGGQINQLFGSSNNKVANFNPFGVKPEKSSGVKVGVPGSLGGTPANPVFTCSAGACSLDYGDFILTGLPENFGSFVETAGTSGGTDQMAQLLDQIAQELKDKGDTEGYKDFQKLADLGHMLADVQMVPEQIAKDCKSNASPAICFKTAYNNPSTFKPSLSEDLPTNLSSILTDYDSADFFIADHTIPGDARNDKMNDLDQYNDLKTQYPAYAIVEAYDNIMSKSKYSETLKKTTTELYRNIDFMARNLAWKTSQINERGFLSHLSYDLDVSYGFNDPVDGSYNYGISQYAHNPDSVFQPQTSKKTDFNSALICVGGQKDRNGHDCALKKYAEEILH